MQASYYDDLRYCDACSAYVRYLQALDRGYCVECGGRVKIFSREDLRRLAGTKKSSRYQISGEEGEWEAEDPRRIS